MQQVTCTWNLCYYRTITQSIMMEENKQKKHEPLFVEIDTDTILKLVKLNKPNELQADWLKILVEHACVCEKWRAEQV